MAELKTGVHRSSLNYLETTRQILRKIRERPWNPDNEEYFRPQGCVLKYRIFSFRWHLALILRHIFHRDYLTAFQVFCFVQMHRLVPKDKQLLSKYDKSPLYFYKIKIREDCGSNTYFPWGHSMTCELQNWPIKTVVVSYNKRLVPSWNSVKSPLFRLLRNLLSLHHHQNLEGWLLPNRVGEP